MQRPTRWREAVLVVLLVALATACPYRFATVGDSVTWGSADEIRAVGGYDNSIYGLDIPGGRVHLRQLLRRGHEVVVVALGGIDLADGHSPAVLRRRVRAAFETQLAEFDCVIWLEVNENPNLWPDWPARSQAFNAMLREEADRFDAHVAPWARLAARHVGDWFVWDGVHLRHVGQVGYAEFIARWVRQYC